MRKEINYSFIFLFILLLFPNNMLAQSVQEETEDRVVATVQTVSGLALEKQVYVYDFPELTATVLKSYQYGHLLKYRPYSDSWYEATVFMNGTRKIGYIHRDDVGGHDEAKSVQGVALKHKTPVYRSQSTKSDVLKSYTKSHILKYRAYDNDWFIATVLMDGQAKIGYIDKKDVGPLTTKLTSYAQKDKTTVYSEMSRSSKKLRQYAIGSTLTYRAHTKNWHQATVILNGKAVQGYIHTKDIHPNKPTLTGYGAKSATRVYKDTSRKIKHT